MLKRLSTLNVWKACGNDGIPNREREREREREMEEREREKRRNGVDGRVMMMKPVLLFAF